MDVEPRDELEGENPAGAGRMMGVGRRTWCADFQARLRPRYGAATASCHRAEFARIMKIRYYVRIAL